MDFFSKKTKLENFFDSVNQEMGNSDLTDINRINVLEDIPGAQKTLSYLLKEDQKLKQELSNLKLSTNKENLEEKVENFKNISAKRKELVAKARNLLPESTRKHFASQVRSGNENADFYCKILSGSI